MNRYETIFILESDIPDAEREPMLEKIKSLIPQHNGVLILSDAATPCPPCGMCRQALAEFGPEMPVLMVFLAKIGMVDVAFLNRNRKYAILVNFIVAAVLTPTPDVVNQMMMGIPLLVLYEISVLAVWLFGRRSFKDFAPEAEGESDDLSS